ncbi:hypothetical protein [Niallia sp. MER TA 168]|uniref:hypothetical protein n=1 Tax=Niallia sp. MER TA 168 TaxID=2939568 RepID=UPI00203F5319|nr:hypothetical protein [Niallia sp. MER TA 168]MCM3363003.1 hypothetical protein [Niallia sp. MER TA 168]
MEWIFAVLCFILGLFVKDHLPSYMKEKGKNLATKEDIKEITKKTEEVKIEFQKEMANFSSEVSFKNDYSYKQYAELYAKLYSIVAQSEYLRYFYEKQMGKEIIFKEVPFFELGRTKIRTQSSLLTGKVINHEETAVSDGMTNFNKKELCEYIIKNGEYSSQRLLKLAVAYRYVHSNYSGTKSLEDNEVQNSFDNEEIKLINKVVRTIVMDYNSLRRDINLEYNQFELENGYFDRIDFN